MIVLASLVLTTDGQRVFFFGDPLPGFCGFKSFFGFRCPGCGLTRSFVYSARFHFVDAFHAHPLGPVGFLMVLGQIPWRLRKRRIALKP